MGAGVVVQEIFWNNHPVCAPLVATQHFLIVNTSSSKPYDYTCVKQGVQFYVEVKGYRSGSLAAFFGDGPLAIDFRGISALADTVRLVQDRTRVVAVHRSS